MEPDYKQFQTVFNQVLEHTGIVKAPGEIDAVYMLQIFSWYDKELEWFPEFHTGGKFAQALMQGLSLHKEWVEPVWWMVQLYTALTYKRQEAPRFNDVTFNNWLEVHTLCYLADPQCVLRFIQQYMQLYWYKARKASDNMHYIYRDLRFARVASSLEPYFSACAVGDLE